LDFSKRILKKLNKSDINPHIQSFLRDILTFELEHYEEARPLCNEKYSELIDKYIKHCQVSQNEN